MVVERWVGEVARWRAVLVQSGDVGTGVGDGSTTLWWWWKTKDLPRRGVDLGGAADGAVPVVGHGVAVEARYEAVDDVGGRAARLERKVVAVTSWHRRLAGATAHDRQALAKAKEKKEGSKLCGNSERSSGSLVSVLSSHSSK